jgi:hypothetical protein
MNEQARATLLYGTEEPAPPPRLLRAGALTAELDAGNLRAVRFGGVEMVRGIAYLVRSRAWATFVPRIADLDATETPDGFAVRYRAQVQDGEARLDYAVTITGSADGTLVFTAEAEARAPFVTCRAGFVVLHPAGVAGAPVEVEHVDGSRESTRFPDLIDPVQPMRDLRALTHEFAPGARVTCRMEGDTFEMEDQRNWTDASYKTYVRPLALPWPYTLAPRARFTQSVALTVAGRPAAAAAAGPVVRVEIGAPIGPMPTLALGCDPAEAAARLAQAAALCPLGIRHLICRFDPGAGHDAAALAPVRDLAAALGAAVDVQLVVPSLDAVEQDIAEAAAALRSAGLVPAAVAVSPAADLKSTPPGSAWPPCPDARRVLAAARRAFPGVPLGGGMFSYFTELNRKRPPLDLIDYVTFSTSAIVHAADDRAVMETLEALPAIAASVRAIAGERPYAVGPSGIGMRDNPYGPGPLENPANARVPMAGRDPRHFALFNAAFSLGYIARFAAGGAVRIALGAPAGNFAVCDLAHPWPVFHVLQGCVRLAGATLHAVRTGREHDVLGLLAEAGGVRTLWLANLTGGPVRVAVPFRTARVLDAACGPAWHAMREQAVAEGTLTLDAYAVAELT